MKNTQTIPLVYAIDIDATQKVLTASVEILYSVINSKSIMSYFGLIDELASIVMNIGEAKTEVKDLNDLEIQTLISENIPAILKKFNVLNGTSKYGIDNLKDAIMDIAEIVSVIKAAAADGLALNDVQYLPEIFKLIMDIYLKRNSIVQEAQDIQASELADLASTLYGFIIWILGK